MTRIDITTGSRLHFGLICGTQESGWEFGGVGMMLRHPSWLVSLQPGCGDSDVISATEETMTRVQEFLKQIRSTRHVGALSVAVREEVPFHTGLGGGTQLGLALAAGIELLAGQRLPDDPWQLAQLAHRAERSAIGTLGFRDGGFLVDYGLAACSESTRRVDRISIPEEWRFVFVRPVLAQGLCGDQERRFFTKRMHMPELLVEHLGEQIEQQLVPSIRGHHFDDFASALESYGRSVGTFYAAQQGDVFAHPVIRSLVAELASKGVHGFAQSSWGPGVCIPARSLEHAVSMAKLIPHTMDQTDLSVVIAEPLNVGASIRSAAPERRPGQFA